LPQCTAVCNPNQPGCPYPDKHLAGVGVAWKLAWATAKVLSGGDKVTDRLRAFLLDSLSLVAVGTVADCAILSGENRILVHHGLQALAKSANPGLTALREHCRLEIPIAATDVGWRIGPLLNAAGRVGSAMANIRLLTAGTLADANAELDKIIAENDERKRLTQVLTDQLFAEIAADTSLRDRERAGTRVWSASSPAAWSKPSVDPPRSSRSRTAWARAACAACRRCTWATCSTPADRC
jgi:single-stranded-DNA-specific exonuclease